MGRFNGSAERVEDEGMLPDGAAVASLRADLRHLLRLYNLGHPADSMVGLSVYRRVVPVRGYAGPASVTRRLLAATGE
jgi:hypothetical protein